MRQLLEKHRGETIAAVSHMAVLRCTLLYSGKRPLNDYRKLDIPNAAAFCFDVQEGNPADGLELKLVEEIHGQ
jgi:broad specificity phosphatase PhoE